MTHCAVGLALPGPARHVNAAGLPWWRMTTARGRSLHMPRVYHMGMQPELLSLPSGNCIRLPDHTCGEQGNGQPLMNGRLWHPVRWPVPTLAAHPHGHCPSASVTLPMIRMTLPRGRCATTPGGCRRR